MGKTSRAKWYKRAFRFQNLFNRWNWGGPALVVFRRFQNRPEFIRACQDIGVIQ